MNLFNFTQTEVLWMLGVTIAITLFWVVVHIGFRYWINKRNARGKNTAALGTIQKILKAFFILFGIGLISYVFVDKENHSFLTDNIGRVSWISLVSLVSIITATLVASFFDRRIAATSRRDRQDATTYKYLKSLSGIFIYATGAILAAIAIPALRELATTALTGAGVLALIIGVAAQEAFANVIGGLFIAFFKPFRLGDVIKVGETVGHVEDLTLRHTVIKNFQNKRIIIPNAIINKENIVNYNLTEYKICEFVEVGISYDSDLALAMNIMREEANTHPYILDNRSEKEKKENSPVVDVQVISLGDSSVNIRAWVWAATYVTGFKMRNDLYKNIKLRFDKEGIEIPFPHRTIVHKNLPTLSDESKSLQTSLPTHQSIS